MHSPTLRCAIHIRSGPLDSLRLCVRVQAMSENPIQITGEPHESLYIVNPQGKRVHRYASMLGRLGGLKGGLARAAKLSPERRKEIAKQAAAARWNNRQ